MDSPDVCIKHNKISNNKSIGLINGRNAMPLAGAVNKLQLATSCVDCVGLYFEFQSSQCKLTSIVDLVI